MSKAGKLRVPDYLGHILEAIRRIHLYVEDMAGRGAMGICLRNAQCPGPWLFQGRS